jgi:hypothetical protein
MTGGLLRTSISSRWMKAAGTRRCGELRGSSWPCRTSTAVSSPEGSEVILLVRFRQGTPCVPEGKRCKTARQQIHCRARSSSMFNSDPADIFQHARAQDHRNNAANASQKKRSLVQLRSRSTSRERAVEIVFGVVLNGRNARSIPRWEATAYYVVRTLENACQSALTRRRSRNPISPTSASAPSTVAGSGTAVIS